MEEDGSNFHENAEKKVRAYADSLKDSTILVIGDDSGIEIDSLNKEPGVRTKRWAGYEMSDQEIINYCVVKMKGLHDDERRATFKTVLALGSYRNETLYFEGELDGIIEEEQPNLQVSPGLPFGTIFYIPEVKKLLYELHGKSLDERGGFMTHRERALHKLYEYLSTTTG